MSNDINGYPKAPPSFRIWAGGTVYPEDIKILLVDDEPDILEIISYSLKNVG